MKKQKKPSKVIETELVPTIARTGQTILNELAKGVFPIPEADASVADPARYRTGRKNEHTIYFGEDCFIGSCVSGLQARRIVEMANVGLDECVRNARFYECVTCSNKPGSPTLCSRCNRARVNAGSRWRGQLPENLRAALPARPSSTAFHGK